MANLQVKNVPESLHQRLRLYAEAHHTTLGQVVLRAIERDLQYEEFYRRLGQRAPVDLGVTAASLLEDARRERDGDAGRG